MTPSHPTAAQVRMPQRLVSEVLPAAWFTCVIAAGVACTKPGIYQWTIEGVGTYIGKFGRIRRPTKEYGRNVARLLAGLPYRLGKPDQFRAIHHALADAVRAGRVITLTILENAEPDEINRRERDLIAERGTLNGPVRKASTPEPI